MRIAAALLLLAGCDYTWNLDHLPEPTDFDLDRDCPANYNLALWPGSRFRIGDTPRTAWSAHDRCDVEAPGIAHLAVAPTRDKLDALIGALTARADNQWWIGAVQPTTATEVGADWLWLTGEPIDPGLWVSPEPNDGNGFEDDHEDQFVFIQAGNSGLIDAKGITLLRFLCECDGRSITIEATAAVDQSRQL